MTRRRESGSTRSRLFLLAAVGLIGVLPAMAIPTALGAGSATVVADPADLCRNSNSGYGNTGCGNSGNGNSGNGNSGNGNSGNGNSGNGNAGNGNSGNGNSGDANWNIWFPWNG